MASQVSRETMIRHRNERALLKRAKRRDCRKQLAIFAKSDTRILVGFVNMYHDGKAFWHDVTTSGKLGRTYPLGENMWTLPEKTMREMSGIFDKSTNVYATRF
jgi:hypothetical protein